MKKNLCQINVLLIATVSVVCLSGVLLQAFAPGTVFPKITIPFLVLLSAAALAAEHYLVRDVKREWLKEILTAGITFTILPLCAGWNVGMSYWKLFIAGTVVFGLTEMVYTSIGSRMSSGRSGKFAPVIQVVLLYLASQCLQGLI